MKDFHLLPKEPLKPDISDKKKKWVQIRESSGEDVHGVNEHIIIFICFGFALIVLVVCFEVFDWLNLNGEIIYI